MKATILYDSRTGHTEAMAGVIAAGMETCEGMRAMAFPIGAPDWAWAKESRCIIVGSPIYSASVTADVMRFLEKDFKACAPAGKLGGAFATADYVHGGGELGIRLILDRMMVCGMLTYSGGGALGRPVIHLGPVAISGSGGAERETFRLYGARMAQKALEIFPQDD